MDASSSCDDLPTKKKKLFSPEQNVSGLLHQCECFPLLPLPPHHSSDINDKFFNSH